MREMQAAQRIDRDAQGDRGGHRLLFVPGVGEEMIGVEAIDEFHHQEIVPIDLAGVDDTDHVVVAQQLADVGLGQEEINDVLPVLHLGQQPFDDDRQPRLSMVGHEQLGHPAPGQGTIQLIVSKGLAHVADASRPL